MKGLYVIIDPEHCRGRDPLALLDQVLQGGCALIQLRAKQLTDRAQLALARAMRQRCHAHKVPFWLNDRADLALLCEADGLHLGQDDVPPAEARKLSPTLPLGLSTHNLAQVETALSQPLALIGFGPVFDTRSKLRPDPTVGLTLLSEACRAAGSLPVVAIGGITLEHAAALRQTGASYAAVIGAVCGADDPRQAAYQLQRALCG